MTPTPEQAAIVAQARDSTDNILINALAGAAKTSTLVLIAEALTREPILSIAFNKRIAQEMEKRLPSHVKSATVNSVGHNAWAKATGRKLMLEKDKISNLLKEDMEAHRAARRQFPYFETIDALRKARILGYIPENAFPGISRVITTQEFADELEDEPDWTTLNRVLVASIKTAYAGLIDFDDQIYMSTLFGGKFPEFPLVLVDEAQDLSPLNHLMLQRLVVKRLIAVGDPWQSIYAFRGAASDSMGRLREAFTMKEMGLSVSFRCPRRIVERARFRAPNMQWFNAEPEGEVIRLDRWSIADVPDGAAIICRNNAPLFKLAFLFLKQSRGVNLVGTDLGPQLVRALKKLGLPAMPQIEVMNAIDAWAREKMRKAKVSARAAVADRAECLRVFASFGPTLGGAIAHAEHLFKAQGPIQLLSGHKAKGLEWDVVYHLDPWRIPSQYAETLEDQNQELNVRYVIETRPKQKLLLVDLERVTP